MRLGFTYIDHSIEDGTQWAVFEPNRRLRAESEAGETHDHAVRHDCLGHFVDLDEPDRNFERQASRLTLAVA